MEKLNGEFLQAYGLMEQDYGDCRHDISCISMEGPEKENAVNQLVAKYEPVRRDSMQRLGEITAGFTDAERETHQEWVRQTDHWKSILEAPFCWRIIKKPEGYPGDYRLMEMIYANRLEGETDRGQFIHKQAVENVACQPVRNRKDFLREQILELNSGGVSSVLSVAAGPVRVVSKSHGSPVTGVLHCPAIAFCGSKKHWRALALYYCR